MNIMIAAVGVEPGHSALGGSVEGAAFVAVMAAAGLVLLYAGGRLLRTAPEPVPSRYSDPRY